MTNTDTTAEKRLTPPEWEKEFGVRIMDPDGWDRTRLDDEWATPITEEDFKLRAQVSTIMTVTPDAARKLF